MLGKFNLLGDGSGGVGRSFGSGGLAVSLGLTLDGSVGVFVLLSRAVNGDLDGDLTALDLLAVHVGASLLLELLRFESDETEATALAGLVASLELANHETRDGTESDLS